MDFIKDFSMRLQQRKDEALMGINTREVAIAAAVPMLASCVPADKAFNRPLI